MINIVTLTQSLYLTPLLMEIMSISDSNARFTSEIRVHISTVQGAYSTLYSADRWLLLINVHPLCKYLICIYFLVGCWMTRRVLYWTMKSCWSPSRRPRLRHRTSKNSWRRQRRRRRRLTTLDESVIHAHKLKIILNIVWIFHRFWFYDIIYAHNSGFELGLLLCQVLLA